MPEQPRKYDSNDAILARLLPVNPTAFQIVLRLLSIFGDIGLSLNDQPGMAFCGVASYSTGCVPNDNGAKGVFDFQGLSCVVYGIVDNAFYRGYQTYVSNKTPRCHGFIFCWISTLSTALHGYWQVLFVGSIGAFSSLARRQIYRVWQVLSDCG